MRFILFGYHPRHIPGNPAHGFLRGQRPGSGDRREGPRPSCVDGIETFDEVLEALDRGG